MKGCKNVTLLLKTSSSPARKPRNIFSKPLSTPYSHSQSWSCSIVFLFFILYGPHNNAKIKRAVYKYIIRSLHMKVTGKECAH